jgi:predicted metal-dependent hydrolase
MIGAFKVGVRVKRAASLLWIPMEDESAGDLWAEGVRLFNQGRFFDCHEVWERLWKQSSGAEKLFYQGMIQAAAALLHVQRGEFSGARSTWAKARAKLEGLPAEHHGIALGDLRTAAAGFIAAALAGGYSPAPRIFTAACPRKDRRE